ncbi:hypothetical protein [Prosthecobacter sp.]|uniref:hypothetical protein n=1 Tax=Prosthecobacter sp. TaxID=1965333 RepID=UPI0037835EE7
MEDWRQFDFGNERLMRIQSPETWAELYRDRTIYSHQLFLGLIHCVKFHDPAKVISVLSADDLEGFKALLAKYSAIKDFNDLKFVGNPPEFGKTEVDKLAKLLGIASQGDKS